MDKIKVLLVDDHHMFLLGIRSIIVDAESVQLIGEAHNGREAYEKTKLLKPGVVIMDLNMPVCDGLEGLKLIKSEMPEVKVIILTVNDGDENLFEALKHGASGYLLKNILPDELITFINMVHRGEPIISGSMALKIIKYFSSQDQLGRDQTQPTTVSKETEVLTRREKEILQQVIKGLTNKEIAKILFISENTVKNHMRNMMEKLHINNRVQAATYALKEGLLNSEKIPIPVD